MMPYCEWKRCKNVAKYMIDLKIDDMRPWICNKHMNKLVKFLGLGDAK